MTLDIGGRAPETAGSTSSQFGLRSSHQPFQCRVRRPGVSKRYRLRREQQFNGRNPFESADDAQKSFQRIALPLFEALIGAQWNTALVRELELT
ncbi:MAG: hypothetical protein ACXWU9_03440 [Telluria sp.]